MRIRPNISVRDGRYWGMALENQGTSPKISISEQAWRAARKTAGRMVNSDNSPI
jgi:hypothetical protein